MNKIRFTEAQFAFALMQAATGTKIDKICRKMGISDATFYTWCRKYGGFGPLVLTNLKLLEQENSKLKPTVADFNLDKAMLRDVP